jgi:Fe-S-cluster containining protein
MVNKKYFTCKVGECGKCCTESEFKIPVTLGDLYRNYVLERTKGNKKTFYQVFKERCNDWMSFPNTRSSLPLPVPLSRIPCYNFDPQRKICNVHDTARYVTCGAYPEECLMDVDPEAIDYFELSPGTKEFSLGLECLKDVKITEQEKVRVRKIAELRGAEILVTGMAFNHPLVPTLFDPDCIDIAEPALVQMIKLMEKEDYMRKMWKCIGQTQKDYMDIFKVKFPDYTALVI